MTTDDNNNPNNIDWDKKPTPDIHEVIEYIDAPAKNIIRTPETNNSSENEKLD